MKTCFVFLLTAFVFSCQSQTVSKNLVSEPKKINDSTNVIKIQEETSDDKDIISTATLKCGDKIFDLVVEYKDDDSKIVNIKEGDTITKTINLPNQSEVNGFSLNWAKETKEGFEISIEYGSRLYYQKDFGFICKQNNFYLSEVKIATFDKHNPESSWKERSRIIKPELPLEKFLITDFLGNN
jgi:hypothetical protein